MYGFAGRLAAAEGSYFRQAEEQAMQSHVERMVAEGRLPQEPAGFSGRTHLKYGVLADIPTEVKHRPASEYIYSHVKSPFMTVKSSIIDKWQYGTPVNMGRSRWTVDGASIFSVNDGKTLASTPPKQATIYEQSRFAKMQRAAMETPLVAGYRVLPAMTPGRAFFWGTILAVWGTGALSVSAARLLGINTMDQVPDKLRGVFDPWIAFARRQLGPLKGQLAVPELQGGQTTELAQRLRLKLKSQ